MYKKKWKKEVLKLRDFLHRTVVITVKSFHFEEEEAEAKEKFSPTQKMASEMAKCDALKVDDDGENDATR